MKFSLASTLVVALAAETALASSWFSKAAYNKWHQTELERWLSDHDVPYPTPADRKDLENLVKTNWQTAVESPYLKWDTKQLQKQLEVSGAQVQKGAQNNKDELAKQVKSSWSDTVDSANTAYGSVKDWIFDSWTDSTLKAFADKHGIPVPQPRKRDTLLKSVRENYQSAANKAGETIDYPGNWLYQTWSESDLKAWLDSRGIPAPQPSNRDKLVASVRRNSRIASLNAQKYADAAASSASSGAGVAASSASSGAKGAASSVSSGAAAASDTLSEKIFDTWSESQLKAWADKNGIKVPQGSTKNELLAIARKNYAKLTGDNVSNSAASAYGAATSSAGNIYSQQTDAAYAQATGLAGWAQSAGYHYLTEAQIALGLRQNYASSASKSAASVYAQASKGVKGEL